MVKNMSLDDIMKKNIASMKAQILNSEECITILERELEKCQADANAKYLQAIKNITSIKEMIDEHSDNITTYKKIINERGEVMSKIYKQMIVDLNSYYFEEDEVEAYQRLKNSNRAEQKLWLIKQVVEGNIEIVDFQEYEGEW